MGGSKGGSSDYADTLAEYNRGYEAFDPEVTMNSRSSDSYVMGWRQAASDYEAANFEFPEIQRLPSKVRAPAGMTQ